jgi:glyoxylase-like metal-dependent hydrolase (beta-lactamase superfamily II)
MRHPWFRTRQIGARTWAIDDHGSSLMYLIAGCERALLIDTGWGVGDLSALVASLTSLPLLVVNTHGHPDHVGGNGQFPRVHVAEADRALAAGGLATDCRRWSLDHDLLPRPLPPGFRVDAWLASATSWVSIAEGDRFELGARCLEVIALPGHSPGSICLLDRSSRSVFTGDSLLPSAIWMHLDESLPLGEFQSSLRRLQAMSGEFDCLWPAHGSLERVPLPQRLLEEVINGVGSILAGTATGKPEHTFAGDGLRRDFGTFSLVYRPDRL